MKIYLDDERKIPDASWTLVRSYEAFQSLVQNTSEPITEISFDHDLGIIGERIVPSGYDAAKWLVDQIDIDKSIGKHLQCLNVHSANPPGADNIRGYLKSARKVGIIHKGVKIS